MGYNGNGIFRNYRFILIALGALMLILMLRSSTPGIQRTDSRPNESSNGLNPISVGDKSDIGKNAKPGTDLKDEAATSGKAAPVEPPVAAIPNAVKDTETEIVKGQTDLQTKLGKVSGQTKSCNKDHQHIVMIDAGSTGSRVHVYEFDVCSQPPVLVQEHFKQIKPGLSSYDADAESAAKSLDPLLAYAREKIPEGKRNCSPVAVKATAGLRLLGDAKAGRTLEAVRKHLQTDFEFPVVEGDGVSIMSGDDEGVYAWITANYLLGNIGGKDRSSTSAVFDLGGGSTQLVFEPKALAAKDPEPIEIIDTDRKYELDFGNEKYKLYQVSHLGYGLMEARNRIHQQLVEAAINNGQISADDTSTTHKLTSPCLSPGTTAPVIKVTLPSTKTTYSVKFVAPTTSMHTQCRAIAERILKKDAECSVKPCSFNGIHQPSLIKSFPPSSDLYVFSYFYDRTYPIGLPLSYTVNELFDLTKNVCADKNTWKSSFGAIDGALAALEEEHNWCMDLVYQSALLHTGYDIPLDREVKTAQKLQDMELGWCLGASLPLISADTWKCKVSPLSS